METAIIIFLIAILISVGVGRFMDLKEIKQFEDSFTVVKHDMRKQVMQKMNDYDRLINGSYETMEITCRESIVEFRNADPTQRERIRECFLEYIDELEQKKRIMYELLTPLHEDKAKN